MEAIHNFDEAIKLAQEPDTLVAALLGLIAIYEAQGNHAKAQELYEDTRKIFPNVDVLIEQSKIEMSTPVPVYGGSVEKGKEGVHPDPRVRAQRAEEIIRRLKTKEGIP